jgi:hypothetical protein
MDCYHVTTELDSYSPFPARGRSGTLDGIVLQAVRDGASLVGLVAPPNAPNEPVACTPCSIERVAPPALAPIALRPHSPFS